MALLLSVSIWYGYKLKFTPLIREELGYVEPARMIFLGNPYLGPVHAATPFVKYFFGAVNTVSGGSLGVRLLTIVLGILTVYLAYKLGEEVSGRMVGFLSAFVLAFNSVFVNNTVLAYFDIPLTFLFTLLSYLGFKYLNEERLEYLFLLGFLLVAVTVSKANGIVYSFSFMIASALIYLKRKEKPIYSVLKSNINKLKYFVLGSFSALFLTYIPFSFIPHPSVKGDWNFLIVNLLEIPVLGNYVYLFGNAVLNNFKVLAQGMPVILGSVAYNQPPAWAYIYWIFQHYGLFYILALVLAFIFAIKAWFEDKDLFFLYCLAIFPFITLSLLTIKYSEYMLPMIPVLTVTGVFSFYKLIRFLVVSFAGYNKIKVSKNLFSAIFVVFILGIVLASPTSFSLTDASESGYSKAAEFIEKKHNGEEIMVLAFYNDRLEKHLEDDNVKILSLHDGIYNETEYLEMLKKKEIDMVLGTQNLSFKKGQFKGRKSEIYNYVESNWNKNLLSGRFRSEKMVVYTAE